MCCSADVITAVAAQPPPSPPNNAVVDPAEDIEDTSLPTAPQARYKKHGLRQLIADLIKNKNHRQWLTGLPGNFNSRTNVQLLPVWDRMCGWFPAHCSRDDINGKGVVQGHRRFNPVTVEIPFDDVQRGVRVCPPCDVV